MGLDIGHYFLTHIPNDVSNFILVDEWDLDCNVTLEHYAEYITDIKEYDFNKKILIVENQQELDQLRTSELFLANDPIKIFFGNINDDNLQSDLARYIVGEGLQELETLGLGVTEGSIKYHYISFGEMVFKKGIYFEEVGYQRKGMN